MSDLTKENNTDDQIKLAEEFLLQIISGNLDIDPLPTNINDRFTPLMKNLNLLLKEIKENDIDEKIIEKNIIKSIDVMLEFAKLNYQARVSVSGKNTLFDALGVSVNMLGEHLEVSDNEIRNNRDELATLLNSIDEAVYSCKINNRDPFNNQILFISPQIEPMLGYNQRELINDYSIWINSIHPDDLQQYKNAVEAHLNNKTPICNSSYRIKHKNGEWVHILDRGKITERNTDGTPLIFSGTHTNITKEKKYEKEIYEYEKYFSLSIELMCIASSEGYFIKVNPKFSEVLGYTKEELTARPFFDFTHPDDKEKTILEVEKLTSGIPTIEFKNRYRCKDGSYKWLSWTSSSDPETGLLYATARDVTQQEETKLRNQIINTISRELNDNVSVEEFLISIEKILSKLVSIDNFYVSTYDKSDDSISFIYNSLYGINNITGLPKKRYNGNGLSEYIIKNKKPLLLTGSDMEGFQEKNSLTIHGSKAKSWLGVPLTKKGNIVGSMSVQSFSISNAYREEDKDLFMFIGTQIGALIERKKAEVLLRENETQFRSILEFSPDATLLLNTEGTIIFANKKASETFGYTIKEFKNINVDDLIPHRLRKDHQNHKEKYLKQFTSGLMGSGMDQFGLHKSGKEFPVEISLSNFKRSSEMIIICSIRDITERKLADKELKDSYKELQLIDQINQASLKNSTLKILANEILSLHSELIQSSGGRFYFYDEKNNRLKLINESTQNSISEKIEEKLGIKLSSVIPEIKLGSNFYKAIEHKEILVFQDPESIINVMQEHVENPVSKKLAKWAKTLMNIQSFLIIPYVYENKIFGLLTFSATVKLSDKEIERVKRINNQVRLILAKAKVEQEVEKQRQFNEEVLNNLPADIVVFDSKHNYKYINPQSVKNDEIRNWLIGKNDFDYTLYKGIDNSMAIQRREFFDICIANNTDVEWIDTHRTQQGLNQYMLRKFHPYMENGKIKHVIGYGIDITEQKKSEKLLEAMAEVQTRFIANGTSEEIFETMLQTLLKISESEFGFIGEIKYENGVPYLQTHAVTDSNWSNDTYFSLTENTQNGSFFMNNLSNLFKEVFIAKKYVLSNSLDNIQKRISLSSEYSQLKSFLGIPIFSNNNIVGMVGIANRPGGYNDKLLEELAPFNTTCATLIEAQRNINIRIETEKENRKLADIVSHSNDAIISIDLNGDVISWNLGATKLFGYEKEEIIGKPLRILIPPEKSDEQQTIINSVKVGTFVKNHDTVRLTKKGEKIFVSISAFPLINEKGEFKGVSGILRDISSKIEIEKAKEEFTKKLEQKVKERTNELFESQKQLEQALIKEKQLGELKSRFVSTASHQFRTPMAIIQSNSELLNMITEKSDLALKPKLERATVRIQKEVKRMTELMDDILILGKITSERGMSINKQAFDILEYCRELGEEYSDLQKDGRKVIIKHFGTPHKINVDPKLINHALSNLVSNAFKYSSKGNPELHLHFNDDCLVISVSDDGIGIPENDLANLFQPFHRADNVGNIPGSGLGLAIVKEYVEMNNGTIAVNSRLNKGTEFTITLPF